uniref:Elastin-like n=1 Tax=Parastrongyloides trichosuri TaxID=131310 RepID=A0A0N4ZC64_PARTI
MKSILCSKNDGFSFCPQRTFRKSDIRRDSVITDINENSIDSPFEDIPTRAPETARAHARVPASPVYNIYPIFYPKGPDYCPNMMAVFRFTCQPSKPLRLDLVEFCKEYSIFCKVPNYHRMPGPGLGPPINGNKGIGHVGVSGNFGFGIGAVPGLEVNAGWGVDVGPIPGMGESVGVDLSSNIGLMGARSPLAYRRGFDNPNGAKGPLVGLSGGVGVNPGTGEPIGVGSSTGVGR